MTNRSLREQFKLCGAKADQESRIIRETVNAGQVKPDDPRNASKACFDCGCLRPLPRPLPRPPGRTSAAPTGRGAWRDAGVGGAASGNTRAGAAASLAVCRGVTA